jgi:hypothetical protein
MLPARIIRLEEGFWRIRSDEGELDAVEQDQLEDYFFEIQMPYRMFDGRLGIPGSISWETLDKRFSDFYNGRAEVFPF